MLQELFRSMILHVFVPDSFDIGMSIPPIKDTGPHQ